MRSIRRRSASRRSRSKLDHLQQAEHLAATLDIGPGTRVFEVDCGRGEFLLPLHRNGYVVGGTDLDAAAITEALAAMPGGLFQLAAATALDPAIPWHVVVCRSFAGAPDLDYLRGVLARMFAKATHAIALLDVPDERRQWMLRALAEVGAQAIQIEDVTIADMRSQDRFNAFARV